MTPLMKPPLDQTRASYDEHALQIADGFWNAQLTNIWETFRQGLPEGAKIADVGCGAGRDTAYFLQHEYQAVGLDYSRGMLLEAMRRAPALYQQGDMRSLPYAAEVFDAAWVCASLLHLPREQAPGAVAEFCRILKPGGSLFLGVKEGQGEGWDMRKGKRFFTYYQENEVRNLLASAGFEIVHLFKESGETAVWLNTFAQKTTR